MVLATERNQAFHAGSKPEGFVVSQTQGSPNHPWFVCLMEE